MAVFELDTADNDGDPLRAEGRLSVLNLAQTYFHDPAVLLVFDEAEDILTPSPMHRGMANSHKGWFNQMLEKNRQPVFWISNSIATLDPAFSRRFDFILEVPIPPKAQRGRILRESAGKLVSPGLIEQLAGIEHLAPAVITRARNVIQAIRREIPKDERDAALTHVIGGILKAQGHPDPAKANIQLVQPGLYDIDHLNTSADLSQIAANLRKSPSARLCLYGPPGTGKTSFGHWLANEIGQPLLLRKASDLLSPYVGVTEQKIARTFETAKEDGAVLLIDEVDSFLRDRTQTRHSWEVTQINEMLTQIESFPGILIASTNLIDQLDPASMRRFDIKLHFGYLLPDQASRLLVSYCHNLNLPQPTFADLELAATMDVSAPGDFAAVARQHRFQPFRDARALLLAVIAESELKANRSRRIGFQ
jgi:SpoVK/Ycf46/Vps4 family AAA+-type ATPase